MPRKDLNVTSWREKRQHQVICEMDPKKRAKANRERFRRQKIGAFRRANDIFVDGLDTGRSRYIYVLIMDNSPASGPRYATYNSHPESDWIPPPYDVANHWPRPDEWSPSSFGDGPKTSGQSAGSSQGQDSVQHKLATPHTIPRAPIFRI